MHLPPAFPRLTLRTLGMCLALLTPIAAHADPKDDARRHFMEGLTAAKSGNYEIALQRFLAAQDAYPHPITLYNIARSYQDLDDLSNALNYYRLFRDASPERAGEIEPVIAVLEARLGQQAAPEAPAGTASPGAVMVAGPTEAELARLSAIAAELEALTGALSTRAAEEAVAAVTEDPEDATEPPEEVELPETPALGEGGFLSEAYEKVVVTASRVGQDPLDSPSSLSVLTQEDIRLSGALSVPDLLRRVVGVDAMSLTAGHSDISIRGFNRKLSNKVLVLIDGRSVYLDFLGTTFWSTLPIEMDEIERIEVIRGPGSSVYGANAVTGVINIITRTPGEGQQIARVDVGSPGLTRGSGVVTGRTGATSYRLSTGFEQHGVWATPLKMLDDNLELDPSSPIVPFNDRPDRAIDTMRFNGRVDHTFNDDWAVSASGGLSTGMHEFVSVGALHDYGNDFRSSYLRGDVFFKNLHLRSFWNKSLGRTAPWTHYRDQERDLNARYNNDAVDVEIEAPLSFETGSVSHVLNMGGGYRYKRIATTYMGGGYGKGYIENHFKGFINEQARLGKLGMVGSLRFDKHPLIPITKTISPRAALIYRLFEKTSLRATAGTAFRVPNSLESYTDLQLPTPADGVFVQDNGNLNLSPERITTYELGLHDESSYYHQADVAVYLNQVSDLIYLSDVERGIFPFDTAENGVLVGSTGFTNLDPKYTGMGIEAEGDLYPVDGLDLFANANLLQIMETQGDQTVRDGSTSSLKLNAGLAYRTPLRTDLSFTAHYLSAQNWRLRGFDEDLALTVVEAPVNERVLLEARVGVRPIPNEDLEFAVTLWNITELFGGDGYIEHPEGQPVLGRAYGTISYRF